MPSHTFDISCSSLGVASIEPSRLLFPRQIVGPRIFVSLFFWRLLSPASDTFCCLGESKPTRNKSCSICSFMVPSFGAPPKELYHSRKLRIICATVIGVDFLMEGNVWSPTYNWLCFYHFRVHASYQSVYLFYGRNCITSRSKRFKLFYLAQVGSS